MNGPIDPVPLLRALAAAEVEHIVIGGFAVISYGVVRVTKDLDVCPAPDRRNLGRLARCLSELGVAQLGVGDFDEDELPFDPTSAEDLAEGGNFRRRRAHVTDLERAAARTGHMRAARSAVIAAVAGGPLLAAACGGADEPVTYQRHGVTVALPAGWQRAAHSLTPNLTDPRETVAFGTYRLVYRQTGCAHMPSSALDDLGPRDALVTLQERGRDARSSWLGFPARPAHFGPRLGGSSEASACVPRARFSDHWFGFSDGGRHFHVLVAFGPRASAATRREAWAILDGLKVDPGVRPDWNSSG